MCVRADEIRHSGAIDLPMYQELLTADVVIADTSTANPNALYQLGIRHALRPRTTIVISENKTPYPFDLNHVTITTYTHLGDSIDFEEALDFRKKLGDTLEAALRDQKTDSPVYNFLHQLTPPSLGEQDISSDQTATSRDQKRCFVVMGLGIKTDYATGRKLDLNKSYRLLIKPAVEEKGLVCVRADEIRHSGAIDIPMYRELLTADVVIADISTAHPNTLYELGIRHALRPRTTIVISENKTPYPFDLNDVTITSYTHLGDHIDFDEALDFRKKLGDTLEAALRDQKTDSPVYIFLHQLTPPSLGERAAEAGAQAGQALEKVGEATAKAVKTTVRTPERAPEDKTLATLTDQGEQAIKSGRFDEAKTLFAGVQGVLTGGQDPYLIQRLVLATYKAEDPNRLEALFEARRLLEPLSPKESNDPDTVRLLGDIEFALFNETQEVDRLVRARQAYERLYAINRDYRSGITLAYIVTLDSEHRRDNAEKLTDVVLANRLRREVVHQGKAKLAEIDASIRTETRLTGVSKAADAAQEKFEVWCAIAEAYYGLGETEEYQGARNEAALFRGVTSRFDTLDSRVKCLDPIVKPQEELLFAVKGYLEARSGSVSISSASTQRTWSNRVESSVHRGGQPVRDLVFFSYSHKDVKWLDDIKKTLKPAFKNRPISMWDDRHIKPGQIWRDAIKEALSRARAAILLISRDFLASEFIADKELPDLLRDAGEDGVILMWVAVEKTLYDDAEFEKYQSLNNPDKPLSNFNENELAPEIVSICQKIRDRVFPK